MQARHAILALPPLHHHTPIIILRGCTPIILGSTTHTTARILGAGAPGIVVGDIQVGLTMGGGIAAGGGDDNHLFEREQHSSKNRLRWRREWVRQ